ncbi:unnamed protein product, partial [Rotaria socialis]
MNLKIDIDKVQYDASKRSLAKVQLNSLWGKLALNRENYDEYAIVESNEELWGYLYDKSFEVKDLFCGTKKALVRYKTVKEYNSKISRGVNVVIAA